MFEKRYWFLVRLCRQWKQNSISIRVIPNNTCIWSGEGAPTTGQSVEWGITLDCQ